MLLFLQAEWNPRKKNSAKAAESHGHQATGKDAGRGKQCSHGRAGGGETEPPPAAASPPLADPSPREAQSLRGSGARAAPSQLGPRQRELLWDLRAETVQDPGLRAHGKLTR